MRLQSYILSTTTETHEYDILAYLRTCFNRTSFQQQLKHWESPRPRSRAPLQSYILSTTTETFSRLNYGSAYRASIVHPFNNNWNIEIRALRPNAKRFNRTSFQQQLKPALTVKNPTVAALQSYILSTTTETKVFCDFIKVNKASIVHPFNNNWNSAAPGCKRIWPWLQSYILSTTTETTMLRGITAIVKSFNRTSFQQQLKLQALFLGMYKRRASIVHPFNNNWNIPWQRLLMPAEVASIVHPFNNNWNNE